ncbi:MAG: hypothetical protein COW73_00060 [Nitrospirae bacterium CG18_big_fil_WC_8_21_14_2_50_70_55]|nr:MAG: hypothetical protein COW73_00060 [Nitrospirae bacterium CG18_big_fil_WC_8_21_14_2_50_70_55]PIX83090.1 MAG: hypothetical protein COZ33_07305 [Nitrospirae bacterium CG_4_10_14_3_um_filter_70_108]
MNWAARRRTLRRTAAAATGAAQRPPARWRAVRRAGGRSAPARYACRWSTTAGGEARTGRQSMKRKRAVRKAVSARARPMSGANQPRGSNRGGRWCSSAATRATLISWPRAGVGSWEAIALTVARGEAVRRAARLKLRPARRNPLGLAPRRPPQNLGGSGFVLSCHAPRERWHGGCCDPLIPGSSSFHGTTPSPHPRPRPRRCPAGRGRRAPILGRSRPRPVVWRRVHERRRLRPRHPARGRVRPPAHRRRRRQRRPAAGSVPHALPRHPLVLLPPRRYRQRPPHLHPGYPTPGVIPRHGRIGPWRAGERQQAQSPIQPRVALRGARRRTDFVERLRRADPRPDSWADSWDVLRRTSPTSLYERVDPGSGPLLPGRSAPGMGRGFAASPSIGGSSPTLPAAPCRVAAVWLECRCLPFPRSPPPPREGRETSRAGLGRPGMRGESRGAESRRARGVRDTGIGGAREAPPAASSTLLSPSPLRDPTPRAGAARQRKAAGNIHLGGPHRRRPLPLPPPSRRGRPFCLGRSCLDNRRRVWTGVAPVSPLPPRAMPSTTIRVATVADDTAMLALAEPHQAGDFLLPVVGAELATYRAEFLVAEIDGGVVAMGRLKRFTDSLAEVRSLVVHPDHRHNALGRAMVRALLHQARQRGMHYCFALTARVEFFEHLGFRQIDKAVLPMKIWGDCLACPKREACDEVAMGREV